MAAATLPNVCKMPGPPAPFVPTPLPNLGESGNSLEGTTKKVTFDGCAVAIKGATFKSKGDMPSQGTGGGLVSATIQNVTKFVAPGSMDVKAEGKNIQLLGDAMTNNNSNPPNAATAPGVMQWTSLMARGLTKEEADKLCDAACKAMDDRGESRTTQDAMAKQFAKDHPPFYRPNNTNILPEVTQQMPALRGDGMTTLLSSTGAIIGAAGPLAPMSLGPALGMGAAAPGTTTRWDFVVPSNPAAPATNANIRNYVEVKFPGDKLTENQIRARARMSQEELDKIVEMSPADDCICEKKAGKVSGKARQRARR